MNTKWSSSVLTGSLLASTLLMGSAWAQSGTTKPLNLSLPPSDIPAASATAAAPASSSSANGNSNITANKSTPGTGSTANIKPAPGVYYGDTSGHIGNSDVADTPRCDDSKYNDPQVHGSISTGVVSGSHIGTSSYSGGEVNVTKAFGDCDHPTGGISISIGGTTNTFGGPGGYRRGY